MGKTIMIMVEVVIFTAVIGVLASSVTQSLSGGENGTNITGAAAVMLGLTTLFVVIGFVLALLKGSGMGGR